MNQCLQIMRDLLTNCLTAPLLTQLITGKGGYKIAQQAERVPVQEPVMLGIRMALQHE